MNHRIWNATEFNGPEQFAFCEITEFGGCFSPTICVLSCTCSIRGWSTPSPFSRCSSITYTWSKMSFTLCANILRYAYRSESLSLLHRLACLTNLQIVYQYWNLVGWLAESVNRWSSMLSILYKSTNCRWALIEWPVTDSSSSIPVLVAATRVL